MSILTTQYSRICTLFAVHRAGLNKIFYQPHAVRFHNMLCSNQISNLEHAIALGGFYSEGNDTAVISSNRQSLLFSLA